MPFPSLLQRLKERKLVQWALAYLAGAWVLYEATGTALEAWNIPVLLVRAIHVLLVVGFFITLVLAWYHGEKGRQRVSGPELLMVAALLVVAGVALSLIEPGLESPKPSTVTEEFSQKPSVLVLACRNISPRLEDAFLADGIHEAILHRLGGVSGLAVLGRETANWYRENPKPPEEIAAERGLDVVGECSVRKDPNAERILFTFQLLDARGVHIWSNEYDRDLTIGNLFEIQRDIAQQVAGAIGAVLTQEDQTRIAGTPTESLEAYNAYLLGRYWWN